MIDVYVNGGDIYFSKERNTKKPDIEVWATKKFMKDKITGRVDIQ